MATRDVGDSPELRRLLEVRTALHQIPLSLGVFLFLKSLWRLVFVADLLFFVYMMIESLMAHLVLLRYVYSVFLEKRFPSLYCKNKAYKIQF